MYINVVFYPIIRLYKAELIDWSARRRLQWEQHELKATQERHWSTIFDQCLCDEQPQEHMFS